MVRIPSGNQWHSPPFDPISFLLDLQGDLLGCEYRGVSVDSWKRVIANGIDVVPKDSVIYTDYFEKAWEYGDWPKLIMAFDWKHLQKTFCELPTSTPKREVDELRLRFPTMLTSEDGTKLWLSRLKEDDPRLASDYEISYAKWIEEDPFEALRAVLLFVRPEDEGALVAVFGSDDGGSIPAFGRTEGNDG